jgi:predicted nucleic acid-binding protein
VVSLVVLLDAGPLGLVTNPKRSAASMACAVWLQSLVNANWRVLTPEIADYEVRRELLLANKTAGVAQLDALAALLEYLPLTTAAMRHAAATWATARQKGQPTAGDRTIDADMILVGQAMTLGVSNVIVATTNVGTFRGLSPRMSGKTFGLSY